MSLPEKIRCMPQSLIYEKYAPWQEELDRIFLALIEGGLDQVYLYKFVPLSSLTFCKNYPFFHPLFVQAFVGYLELTKA